MCLLQTQLYWVPAQWQWQAVPHPWDSCVFEFITDSQGAKKKCEVGKMLSCQGTWPFSTGWSGVACLQR
jgi:hypothetical protein